MAEAEKKERAAPAKQTAPKAATLQQKFVELRKAIPAIVRGSTNEEHGYTFAKISDVYRLLVPAMNEHGVNFDIVEERATRHDQNGDARYVTSYTQNTGRGERVVWIYEADLVIRWTNAENPKDTIDVTLHAIGTNDGGPDKAKGSAWTYCLKYYLFEKFNIDQGADDPDAADHSTAPSQRAPQAPTAAPTAGGNNYPPGATQGQQRPQGGAVRPLSEAQLSRLYKKAEAAGIAQQQVNAQIFQRYGQQDPHSLTRQQYDEICDYMDNAARQGGNRNAQ